MKYEYIGEQSITIHGNGEAGDRMSEPADEKTARNHRVMDRYDELSAAGKHGHYETMFRIVREEVERERERCARVCEEREPLAGAIVHDIARAIRGIHPQDVDAQMAQLQAAAIRRGSV